MSPIIGARGGLSASAYGLFAPSAAATASYESIQTLNGTGSSGVITFSSIPQTYKHLQIRYLSRTTQNAPGYSETDVKVQFNGDTGANYAHHKISGPGTGSGTSSSSPSTNQIIVWSAIASGASNVYTAGIIDLLDYTSTSKYKTVRAFFGEDFNGGGNILFGSGLWMNTAAVSSISFTLYSDSFTTPSNFALYGIRG